MSKGTSALVHIEDFTNLKAEISMKFGYQPYYDEFNRIMFIRPKISNKLIDVLLDPYRDEIVFTPKECEELYELLNSIHLNNEDAQADLYRLEVVLNSADFSKNNLKICKGAFSYE